jgi:hypothetical protein
MAANTLPIVRVTPKVGVAALSTAVTGRTVTGITGLTLLYTAGANGSLIDSISYTQNGAISTAPSANVLRIWRYTGSGNATLTREIAIGSTTPTATAAGSNGVENYIFPVNQMVVPTGSTLYASLHTYAGVQDGYNVEAVGGDY